MALPAGSAPYSGSSHLPAPVTVDGQMELTSAEVAAGILLSRWSNRASILDVCSRRLFGFSHEGKPVGDTIRIQKRDNHGHRTGTTYSAEPAQRQYVDLTLGDVIGNDHGVNAWVENEFRDPQVERQRMEDRFDYMIDRVELYLSGKMTDETGYHRAVQPRKDTGDPVTKSELVNAGEGSTNYPSAKLYTRIRADFDKRGITGRERCAIHDPDTLGNMTDTVINAPYDNPLGRQAYGSSGMTEGRGKIGWTRKSGVHNGKTTFPAKGAITYASGLTQGATSARLNIPAGVGLKKGDRIAIETCYGVNESTKEGVSSLAGFVVTSDTPTAGTAKTVNFTPPFNFQTNTEAERRKRTVAAPTTGGAGAALSLAANAAVWVNGIDTSEATQRDASDSKTVERSLMVLRDTTFAAFGRPTLPKRGTGATATFVQEDNYGVAFEVTEFYDAKEAEHAHRIDIRPGGVCGEPEAGVLAGAEVTSA